MAVNKAVLDAIAEEVERSRIQHPENSSAHHGLGVLDEEVHELRMEVYKRAANRDREQMIREAVQVAACAVRFIEEVCKWRS